MITHIKNRLNRFRKEDAGAVYTLEFAVLLPLLFMALFFGVELTTHANRQFQLDRGLEVTTRLIRLNTAVEYTHDELKQAICANTGGLEDCDNNMRLELLTEDLRNYTGLPARADCTNSPVTVTPVRGWSLGEQHELMLMRACYEYTPFLASIGLGKLLGSGENGKGEMVAISAFVQEPR